MTNTKKKINVIHTISEEKVDRIAFLTEIAEREMLKPFIEEYQRLSSERQE
ncbi:hypothetical protein [Paraliobacillus sp. X-1268]|uniref:hypothetical protein n=1 Tax=Paraliobacillus sp. X-1268 TaxID=2213193 RepID=UPI0013008B21|nr:hypothetical protein [Paraliobacillus sp. X-1268]